MKSLNYLLVCLGLFFMSACENPANKQKEDKEGWQKKTEKEVKSEPMNGSFSGKLDGKSWTVTSIKAGINPQQKENNQLKIDFFGEVEGESISLVVDLDEEIKKVPSERKMGEKGEKRKGGASKAGVIVNLKEEGKVTSYFKVKEGKLSIKSLDEKSKTISGSFEVRIEGKDGKKYIEVTDVDFKDVKYE